MFVTQGVWCAADQTEESIAPRFDVGAVLDVGVRPKPGRRLIIALVEQGVERLQHQGFVLFGCRLRHTSLQSGGSDRADNLAAPAARLQEAVRSDDLDRETVSLRAAGLALAGSFQ